jgi:WD40 repeat protein
MVQAKLADDVVDLREHTDQLARLATAPADEEPKDRPAAAVCPYKGLARYEPEDAPFFFGRERLVAELITHLVGAGLVGVVGPSGSGKSSLVRAGLLPALGDGALPGSDRWRQVLLRPGEHPMAELGVALGASDSISASTADAPTGATARGDGEAGDPVLGRTGGKVVLEAAARAPTRLLLVVDQFEEVFTSCRDEVERARFLAALTEAAQAADGQLTVIVAVRADYYGHCAADPRLASLLAANHLLVGPMDADELRRAIESPARRAGLRLEPGLAEAMIGEVAEEPGGLPLLSCALLESWQHRHGRTLTLAAYHQAGGVRGAVARLAERAWQQLDPDDQNTARRILLRLAGPGEGEAVVPRRVPFNELTQSGEERVRAVLDTLTDQRLLTKSQDTVEVAHEALLREWPRLRDWLDDDVQGRALHRHLIGAAREWDQSGRDPGELYRGARLTAALDWAAQHDGDLNMLEREFLEASRAAAEHEVADAHRRAEQEARRAQREAGTSRRLRAALAGLAVLLVLALVAGGLALTLRGRAERAALVADSRRLGAQALLEEQLDRSLLLARQGIALDDSLETRSDLLAALLRSPAAKAILRGDLDGIGALGLSRDGRLLAVGDGDGTMAIYDLHTRRLLQEAFQGHDQVDDLEFSPDGSVLAIATTGATEPVHLWDVQGARLLRDLPRVGAADEGSAVTGVEFSPDGRTLVTLSVKGNDDPGRGTAFLTRWDVAAGHRLTGPDRISSHGGYVLLASGGRRLVVVNGAETLVVAPGSFRLLHRFPHPLTQPRVVTAALSPHDGRTLALWSEAGPIKFLDLLSGRRWPGGRDDGGAWSVRFSPDGTTLVTGDGDGSVKVWDVASGQLRERFQGHEARVLGLGFSPDGRTLYSSGSKSVIAWDLEGASRLGRPFRLFAGPVPPSAEQRPPKALAISPDGALLAAPVASAPDHLALLDLRSPNKPQPPLAPGIGHISAVAFSPNGKQLAIGSEDAPAPVLLDPSGRVLRRLTGGHRGGVHSIAFDPTGRWLATGGAHDLQAIVWDTTSGQPIRHLPHPTANEQQPVSVGWSQDGSMVATGGGQGKVILWRAGDGRPLATFPVDTSWVLAMTFSPDGSLLAASGTGDRQVTLWNVRTRRLVGRLPQPIFVASVAFDLAGDTLATSAADGKVRLWDLASLRQIGRPLPGAENGTGTNVSAFDPSGNHLIAVYDSGTAFVWDINPDHWKQQACRVVGRPLSREEWNELLADRRYRPAC